MHGVRGDSGGLPARGPGFPPDLCPRARPSPRVFTLRKHSTGFQLRPPTQTNRPTGEEPPKEEAMGGFAEAGARPQSSSSSSSSSRPSPSHPPSRELPSSPKQTNNCGHKQTEPPGSNGGVRRGRGPAAAAVAGVRLLQPRARPRLPRHQPPRGRQGPPAGQSPAPAPRPAPPPPRCRHHHPSGIQPSAVGGGRGGAGRAKRAAPGPASDLPTGLPPARPGLPLFRGLPRPPRPPRLHPGGRTPPEAPLGRPGSEGGRRGAARAGGVVEWCC